jgi:succinate dehydrogenase / fumarate reductase membrane anchor subunit
MAYRKLTSGAHYGLRDWLAQRATAVIMAVYTVVLLTQLLCVEHLNYDTWAGLFVPTWMKLLTVVTFAALSYHAWIGVRDIWMDYVKPVSVRLVLHVLTLMWLLASFMYAVQILWRV